MGIFSRNQKDAEKKVEGMDHQALISSSADQYEEKKFWTKLQTMAKKMGSKLVYFSLVLFHALKSPDVPKKAKLTIAGALGYLILPIDVIPDFIPVVGFADDMALIIYALKQVVDHIDDEMKEKANQQVKKWFGESADISDENLKPKNV